MIGRSSLLRDGLGLVGLVFGAGLAVGLLGRLCSLDGEVVVEGGWLAGIIFGRDVCIESFSESVCLGVEIDGQETCECDLDQ